MVNLYNVHAKLNSDDKIDSGHQRKVGCVFHLYNLQNQLTVYCGEFT